MSKKQDKDRRKSSSEEDRTAACDELLEEAMGEEDMGEEDMGEEDFDGFDEDEDFEINSQFSSPLQGKKVWVVLAMILVVVAVAVLYVYQAGDKKTILGNQPIPVGQLNAQNAQTLPVAGAVQNVPIGGGVQNFQNAPVTSRGTGTTISVLCPRCATTGLPVCTSCGTVMKPLSDGSGLFACPNCGSAGIPICPKDGAHMIAPGGSGSPPAAGVARNVGGQFQCPACGATGLPNWDPKGTPLCPSCGTTMNVRSTGNPKLAAAP